MIEHNFKKKFGQNFISDKNLLSAICSDSDVDKTAEVLEIGAGAGTLTEEISKLAKKVVSFEIDSDLQQHLSSLNLHNTKFIFDDVMNYETSEIEKMFDGGYKIIANLPYYITTPIIFKFLNEAENLESLTIMVQKEVAERIVAGVGGKDYGVLSIMIKFFGEAKITRIVSRKMFYPQPNVDSAVVKIEIQRDKYKKVDKTKFYKFIQTVFSMRRKTLKNNLLHGGISEEKVAQIAPEKLVARGETFNLDELIDIYFKIFD